MQILLAAHSKTLACMTALLPIIYNVGMAQQRETRETQNPALLAVGARPDVLVWRQQSGLFRAFDNPDRIVRIGQPGMADSAMIVAVTITPDMVGKTIGVAVQPEFKTLKGGQRENQQRWQIAVEKRGGIYELVRSADQMVDLVERVQAGELFK